MGMSNMECKTETQGPGCIVCGKPEAEALFVRRGKSYYRCTGCGLVYQGEPFSREENQRFYREDYYRGLGDRVPQIENTRFLLYGNILSGSVRRCGTRRLLDVGSGYGNFLKLAKEEGWDVWGIEPSREAAEASREILGDRVMNQTVENVEFPDDYFDVITLWNVLDYLLDPVGVMRKVRQWLSPQGMVIIRIPNVFFHLRAFRFYSRFKPLLERAGWKKEPAVFQRANFNAGTLRYLLSKTGFSDVSIGNAELTQGDAYKVFSSSGLMSAAKSCLSFLSGLIAFASGNRLLIGSSLLACAGKEKGAAGSVSRTTRIRIIMKRVALHFLALIGYCLGLPLWSRLSGKDTEIKVLLYHSVDKLKQNDMNVQPGQFSAQLDFVKKKYAIISSAEAVRILKEKRHCPGPSVVITFDDGYSDNYRVVYPLLREKSVPATIFLLAGEETGERRTSHLGGGYCGEGELLGWDEARAMSGGGVIFGSHGVSHAKLKELGPGKLKEEISFSKKQLETQLGKPVRFFSYPYGTCEDFGGREKALVKEAGYEAAFSKIYGTNDSGADLFSLKRIGIEASDTVFTLRAKLNGALAVMAVFDLSLIRKTIRWINAVFFRGAPAEGKEDPLLLVSVDFPPHTDGVSTISRELSVQISAMHEKMFVIGPKDEGDAEFDARYHYRAFRVPGYYWGYLRFIPILFRMPFVVFRYGIKRIFAMNIAYGGFLSWVLSFLKRLDYMVFAYGYEFEKVKHNSFARWLYLRIYGRARAVVCCSRAVRERLISFGAAPDKVKVLYPAVDLKRYYPREVPREYLEGKGLWGRKILLTTGRLVERKGHDRVIRALPEIKRKFPEVLYCISGIGPNEKNLRDIARESGVEEHVRFLGRLPENELLHLYNACEVFIMPSREIEKGGHIEGFGIVFLEANACGKPVIGGRSGGVLEAIREGETGFLVDPDSTAGIAEKITFMLSEPEMARKMGEKGRLWVKESFNWEGYVKESYKLLCGGELK